MASKKAGWAALKYLQVKPYNKTAMTGNWSQFQNLFKIVYFR